MRRRNLIAALAIALLTIGFTASPAHAAGESVGACTLEHMVELVHEFEAAEEADDHELAEAANDAADECIEAPNPILPEVNEIIWGGLAFVVLLALLWKFAVPAIKGGMQARTDRIRDDLTAAEQAREEAEATLADYQAQLADARAEANRIIDEARQTADSLRADLEARAETDIVEMRDRAAADIEASRAQALADLRGEVSSLAFGAAEQVIGRQMADRDVQVGLIEDYINQVAQGQS